ERHAIRKRAYLYSRSSIWSQTAQRYVETFQSARESRAHINGHLFRAKPAPRRRSEFPLLKLDHLRRMTDGIGIFQHAIYSVPNYCEGYCTDDKARALVLAVLLEESGEDEAEDAQMLATRYLAFLWNAFNPRTVRFRNFMPFDRRWQEDIGPEDCHG